MGYMGIYGPWTSKILTMTSSSEAHAPPLLVCVGGYNSNWNRHEPVLQEDVPRQKQQGVREFHPVVIFEVPSGNFT